LQVRGQSLIMLFGGINTGVVYSDTWLWNGSNWTTLKTAHSPSPRSFHTMAYDSVRGEVVLFGGADPTGNPLNDTWVWDGSDWTEEPNTGQPAPRFSQAMTYDSSHGEVVLFGGANDNDPSYFGDTFVWK
jgi:hypothetical protein